MPVDAASVAAVDAARRSPATRTGKGKEPPVGRAGDVRPLADGYTFAALPATVERLLLGRDDGGLPAGALGAAPVRAERVVLVLLDAFGWRFFERHAARHSLLRRVLPEGTLANLPTQFPPATPPPLPTPPTGP